MLIYKYLFALLFLFVFAPLHAQNALQKKADSTEAVLFTIPASDTARILKTGNYILKNSASYKQKFGVLERISVAYFHVNQIDRSIAYAFKANELAEESGDEEMMAQGNGSIANLYSYLNLSNKARPYLNRAIEHISKMPAGDRQYLLKALSYLEMGNLDFNEKDFKPANKNYRNSLHEFNLIKNVKNSHTYHYRRSLYNIGNSYACLRQPDSAEGYLKRALAIKDIKNPELKYYINSALADVYGMRGNYKRAIDTLQAILRSPGFDIKSLKSEIYVKLSRNYKNTGNNAAYTKYNDMHMALRDTVQGNEREAISTAIDVEQQGLSDSVQRSRRQNTWLIYAICSIVIISIGSIVYLNRTKKKERALYKDVISRLQNQVHFALPQQQGTEQETQPVYSIPPAVEAEILEGLQKFEAEEGFRNPALTVSLLAVQLKTNPAYLSAVIKAHKDSNFNTYINELRIRYICKKIHDQREYGNYKISYLAEDCGFTSHSAFSTVFKKVTGISPSVFLREEEKLNMTG